MIPITRPIGAFFFLASFFSTAAFSSVDIMTISSSIGIDESTRFLDMMLDRFDEQLGSALYDLATPESGSPFLAVELRQLGGATATDTADGTAVGGRASRYTVSTLAADPSTFAELAPERSRLITEALSAAISPVTNVNWSAGLTDRDAFEKTWPPEVFDRLAAERAHWDPNRVFAFGPR